MPQIRFSIVRVDDESARQDVASCTTSELAGEIVGALVARYPERKYVIESKVIRSRDSSSSSSSGTSPALEPLQRSEPSQRRERSRPVPSRRPYLWIVAAMVVYPLSFGPALFFGHFFGRPEWYMSLLAMVYAPLQVVRGYLPEFFRTAFDWYIQQWDGM